MQWGRTGRPTGTRLKIGTLAKMIKTGNISHIVQVVTRSGLGACVSVAFLDFGHPFPITACTHSSMSLKSEEGG